MKYNNDVINNNVPAHLLGSLDGYSWTPIISDVIPYPNTIFDIKKNLINKKLRGKDLYKSAAQLGKKILKHNPNGEFFQSSLFNSSCNTKLINYCRKGEMTISTCSESSIDNFISAHKNVGKILVNQMSEESSPILNNANRYSGNFFHYIIND